MKKRILLVLKEEFADWEAAYLSSWILELGKGNYVVETVSLNKETVRSIGGFRVVPDYGLDEVPETRNWLEKAGCGKDSATRFAVRGKRQGAWRNL